MNARSSVRPGVLPEDVGQEQEVTQEHGDIDNAEEVHAATISGLVLSKDMLQCKRKLEWLAEATSRQKPRSRGQSSTKTRRLQADQARKTRSVAAGARRHANGCCAT